ncbi:MAG TPA: hypothetical protein VHK06_07080 [Candidatus Limnocylindria bacterium]|nr:hypothetical protein [Candidatus Limnocylindria bacterium]
MPGDQLELSIPDDPGRRLPERVEPMQPAAGGAPFDDPDYLFEPWWPGVRAIAFVEAGLLRLQIEGLADAAAAAPELAELPRQLIDDATILDGTLLVLDPQGRPDADLLRRRLSASGSRRGPPAGLAAFVASDLLWSGGRSWARRPYRARRERLLAILPEGDRAVVGRGYEREGTVVADALGLLGIGAMGARRLDARYRPGRSGDAWLRLPVVPRLAHVPTERPTLALIQRLPLA